jgi:hypothetical protein
MGQDAWSDGAGADDSTGAPARSRKVSAVFPPEIASSRAARRLVEEALAGRDDNPWAARLLVSELASNVVRHAHTDFVVTVEVSEEQVRVEVQDGSSVLPALVETVEGAESGRGVHVLAALAADWGADLDGPGKRVWFTLPLTVGDEPPA